MLGLGSMELLDEIRGIIRSHAPDMTRHSLLPGVSIASVDHTTEPAAVMSEPSVAVVAQGVKRTVLNGVPYDYRGGQYLAVSIDLPVLGHVVEAPFAVFTLALRPEAIAGLLLETTTTARPPAFSGLAVSDAPTELLDPIARLLRMIDRPDDIRVLGPALEREILWRLLTGDQGMLVRQIGLADGSLTHIARTIRFLREHLSEPTPVEELAGIAGMSASSFHRHFRAATSMSPLQFQKLLRLQQARALLLARSGDVAEIGYRVGYDSPSQFSREYRRAFGESPARDAARLLAT
jgi:AraC-like DNA-binding protein